MLIQLKRQSVTEFLFFVEPVDIKFQTFGTLPGPSLWKEREGSLRREIYCVYQGNNLFYEAPLFFIKERGAAVAGGECKKY
jgi:hypothetical protein